MILKIWVCERCALVYHLPDRTPPARDAAGRPICQPDSGCRRAVVVVTNAV